MDQASPPNPLLYLLMHFPESIHWHFVKWGKTMLASR
jgi:hypothetical protein